MMLDSFCVKHYTLLESQIVPRSWWKKIAAVLEDNLPENHREDLTYWVKGGSYGSTNWEKCHGLT